MTVATEPRRYTTYASERELLKWLIQRAPGAVVVEIGARDGQTTVELAPFADAFGFTYVVVDPWDGTQDGAGEEMYQTFLTATQGYPITVNRRRSQDAVPPPGLGFVFHDGDHRDPDLQKWWDALVPGGILAVHDVCDAGWPTVRVAAENLGTPWHEYRYQPSVEELLSYGPGPRGLFWKVKD